MSEDGSRAREAVWLTTEEAENAIDRHEAYVLSPQFFGRAKAQTGLVVLGALFLVGAFVATALNPALIPLAMVSVAALSLGSIPLAYFWELRQAARRAPDVALREGFGKGPGQLVELIVRQGDAPTGTDRGMLWIEDRRLYFSGHRTSFGLVPSQIRSVATGEAPIPGLRHETTLRLARETPVGPMSLSFRVVTPANAAGWADQHELQTRIIRWTDVRNPAEGQWPPSAVGPGAPSERRLFLTAFALTVPVPALLLGAAYLFASLPLLLGALVAVLVCFISDAGAVRWRAALDRRRLRRGR